MIEETRVGGQRVTLEYDANGWPTTVTHWPGMGDEVSETSSQTTVSATPEIPHWGNGKNSAQNADQSGAQRTELIRNAAGRLNRENLLRKKAAK